jgi:hypothetical protein
MTCGWGAWSAAGRWFVRPRGSPPKSMRRRLFNLFVWASAGLAVLIALVCVRSFWRMDRLYIRTAAAQWKVESMGGGLTIDRFGGWPGGLAWDYQTMGFDPFRGVTPLVSYSPGNIWKQGPLTRATGRAWVQLTSTGSVDWGSQLSPEVFRSGRLGQRNVAWVSFSSARISYWPLFLLLLLPLAGRVLRAMALRIVKQARRSRGLCAGCGYDIRTSVSRCPECGAAVGSGSGVGAGMV